MEDEEKPRHANLHFIKPRNRLHVSRTRLVMGLLLIVAVAIFVSLNQEAHGRNDRDSGKPEDTPATETLPDASMFSRTALVGG
jgi:hypothetical protein